MASTRSIGIASTTAGTIPSSRASPSSPARPSSSRRWTLRRGSSRPTRPRPIWRSSISAGSIRSPARCSWTATGLHSIIPPRNVGGNMDVRDIAEGTELWLPVEVAGALFSVGDTHAAQGDGEVCGTAIESPIDVTLKFELVKDASLRFPRFTTRGPVTRHIDAEGYEVTTGVGPDLMEGARAAVCAMIDLLTARYGMSAVDAYMLCSV